MCCFLPTFGLVQSFFLTGHLFPVPIPSQWLLPNWSQSNSLTKSVSHPNSLHGSPEPEGESPSSLIGSPEPFEAWHWRARILPFSRTEFLSGCQVSSGLAGQGPLGTQHSCPKPPVCPECHCLGSFNVTSVTRLLQMNLTRCFLSFLLALTKNNTLSFPWGTHQN